MRHSTPLARAIEKQIYSIALALLFFLWLILTAGNLALLVLLIFQDHVTWSDGLRALALLLPPDLAV
jgi:hypothetical protein